VSDLGHTYAAEGVREGQDNQDELQPDRYVYTWM